MCTDVQLFSRPFFFLAYTVTKIANALCLCTLPVQMLTLYYLDLLTKQLKDVGYSHLALPVLALEDLLSRSILKDHSLNVLVHVR